MDSLQDTKDTAIELNPPMKLRLMHDLLSIQKDQYYGFIFHVSQLVFGDINRLIEWVCSAY
jgi:hypothetical protein